MAINTQLDQRKAQINLSSEAGAIEYEGVKSPLQPIETYRHVYTEKLVTTGDAAARLLLETNSSQSWICKANVFSNTLNYRLDVVKKEPGISSVLAAIAGQNLYLISRNTFTTTQTTDVFLPPDCQLYIVPTAGIATVLLTAKRYWSNSPIESVLIV